MTGYYVRTFRGGRWVNVEFTEQTDDELEALEDREPDRGWAWAKALSKWIRDHADSDPTLPSEAAIACLDALCYLEGQPSAPNELLRALGNIVERFRVRFPHETSSPA